MELLSLIALICIVILLVKIKDGVYERLDHLQAEIKYLKQQFDVPHRVDKVEVGLQKDNVVTEEKPFQSQQTNTTAQDKYWESNFKVEEPKERTLEEQLETWQPSAVEIPGTYQQPTSKAAATAIETPTSKPVFTPKPSFFERNPDLEKFIGENLVSKIGIGILVLAIAYFVKFAIDNNWIGEIGRVAVGLICGGILVGLAHRMRNSYKAFSSVLTGGGLAVFYFTIALAYHQFHLFSQSAAFIIMLVITAFAVFLSLIYDRQEVAIIALVGGFASPFMVSDGSGNYKTLFIYLILLNSGLLVLAYYKAWRLLNLLAFIFTVILVGGWLYSLPPMETVYTYRNGFVFLTLFYVLFFAINIAHNIKENKRFIASDFGILLANTALYFIAGLYCLYNMQAEAFKGLFSASMGVVNLTVSYLLFRNRKVDTNILYLLIGITLTFISLTAPLQLEGNFITLFWASECVLLYWLFIKSGIPVIRVSSIVVWVCMLISLLIDWINVYQHADVLLQIIFNKGFVTTLYAAAACYALFLLVLNKTSTSRQSVVKFLQEDSIRLISILVLFFGGALELNHQFKFYYPASEINRLYLQLYLCAFVLILLLVSGLWRKLQLLVNLQIQLSAVCILVYLLMINRNFELQITMLRSQTNTALFTLGHLTVALLTSVIIYRLIQLLRRHSSVLHQGFLAWVVCTVIIVFFSVELNLLVRSVFYSEANPIGELQRVYVKTVLPILWGICSFAFMWLGMKYKYRPLRIISLSLFTLTLLKLFAFDIRNIPVAGKIAAFFCLGILLLVVSFMYQRLKKIIIEDEQKASL